MRALAAFAALLFAAGSSVAQPPTFEKLALDKLGDVKPLAADAADTPVRKLQKEAYNARLAQVQGLVELHKKGVLRPGEIGPPARRVAILEAELFPDPAAGARWYELWLGVLADEEARARDLYQKGAATEDELLAAGLVRIGGRLEFLRFQEARDPKAKPATAEKLKLYEERVKLLTRREERLKELAARGVVSQTELLDARAARLEAEAALLKLKGM